jgi:L-glyceraldehyde 3-phosphate reductase
MALAWNLRQPVVASVLVGASRTSQLAANLKALEQLAFTADELAAIDAALQN